MRPGRGARSSRISTSSPGRSRWTSRAPGSCIKRRVIETIARHVESYDGPNGEVPALFMTPIVDRCLRSEDYYFCEIARRAGFKIMMEPRVRLGHWGLYRYGA